MGPRKNKNVEFEEILNDVIQESMDFNSTLKTNIAKNKNNSNKSNGNQKKATSRFGNGSDLDSDVFPDLWD
ncbi:MAG: hypothetical protein DWQ07_05065 [Chloroflexi bacterium]|nr:MAG: hypothetical protein DWQ07_05065 [Chloroflexota bacterium]MBL1194803.1 hypothetical protein [Chloroflexota bacterium]